MILVLEKNVTNARVDAGKVAVTLEVDLVQQIGDGHRANPKFVSHLEIVETSVILADESTSSALDRATKVAMVRADQMIIEMRREEAPVASQVRPVVLDLGQGRAS